MNAVLELVVIVLVLFLIRLLRNCSGTPAASAIRWTVNGVSFEGKDVRMNLRESQKVSGKYLPTKPDGTPGSIDGSLIITLDPPDSLEVVLGANGTGDFEFRGKTTAVPVPVGYEVKADVDPDPDEVKFIPAVGSILLLPDIAVVATVELGTPEPK